MRCWRTVCALTAILLIHVCPHSTFLYIHMGLQLASALQWKLKQHCRMGGRGFKPAAPLLRVFDQAKIMFTCLATSVAETAIRKCACLVGVETLVLYLNQAKDKRSMAQFRSWIGDKSSQTLGDYEREIYEWKGGPESEGASSSSGC